MPAAVAGAQEISGPVARSAAQTQMAIAVERAVLRQLEDDQLDLPAMPTVALRTVQLLTNPDYRSPDVAALIESDPLLAAQLLRLVNSAAFGAIQPATSIGDCVSRLGGMELRLFLIELSARQVMESRDPRIAAFCRGLWEHSVAVGLLAREIARASNPATGETAYLAGLLHDIGKPLMATLLVAAEQRLLGQRTDVWLAPTQWLTFIVDKHRTIGMALARKWGLPEAIGRGITDSAEYDALDPRSVANAVRLANALAKHNGLYVGDFDADEVQALAFVGEQLFGLAPETRDAMVAKVRDQIASRVG